MLSEAFRNMFGCIWMRSDALGYMQTLWEKYNSIFPRDSLRERIGRSLDASWFRCEDHVGVCGEHLPTHISGKE